MSNRMGSREPPLVALIPAAGFGSRLPSVVSSKEMLPIPMSGKQGKNAEAAEPVICHLLRSLRRARVAETRIVLRQGKWDILDYLCGPVWDDMRLNYVITRGTKGVPQTVALGLQDYPEADILFGFPDILFEPANAFETLASTLKTSTSDVVLGAFPTENPSKMDMLQINPDGQVAVIDIKPEQTTLEFAWIMAAWKPSFSQYFLDLLRDAPKRLQERTAATGDLHLGHALQLAIQDGLRVEAHSFAAGRSLDIGTPEDLERARNWFGKDEQG